MPKDLWPNERYVVAQTQTGEEAKFDKLTPKQLADPAFMATMPVVRAPVIRALCLGEWEDVRVHGKGVRIIGADIKGDCQSNTHENEEKVGALARDIHNDREAVMAFVNDPGLPATNNDAERARRHTVVARRICCGTRTDENSRFDAAALTVIQTWRQRTVNIWSYAAGLPVPPCPQTIATV